MTTTQILAIGSGEATSTEVDVASGSEATLAFNDASGPTVPHGAHARVEIKDPAGSWFEVGFLMSDVNGRDNVKIVSGPGTYRVTRLGSVACGVFAVT